MNYQPYAVWLLRDKLRKQGWIKDTDDYVEMFYYPNSFIKPPMMYFLDRSQHIRHFLPVNDGKAPWPSYDPAFSKSFGDVCLERAKELLSFGQVINVHWSGGLDSTTALLSIMLACEKPEQIRVLCSPDSIVESGPLFDRFIKHSGVQIRITERMSRERFYKVNQFDEGDIFTDGGVADQLYGAQLFYDPHWRVDLLDKPWVEAVLAVLGDEQGRKVVDFLWTGIEKAVRPIQTYREFLWFYKTNYGWYTHKFQYQIRVPTQYLPRWHKFFEGADIQRWAMIHGPGIIEEQPDKMPQRMWIYEMTKFAEYSFLKQRYRSSGNIFFHNWMFTLEDGSELTYPDIVNGASYVGL